jgi:hypothetical protein
VDEQWQDALKMYRALMLFRFKKTFALLATMAYMAAVVILIHAIATQARIESYIDARQQIVSSPLNLDDPCNRSNSVEIKFCEREIGVTKTRHRIGQAHDPRAASYSVR